MGSYLLEDYVSHPRRNIRGALATLRMGRRPGLDNPRVGMSAVGKSQLTNRGEVHQGK